MIDTNVSLNYPSLSDSKKIIILCHTSEEQLGRIYIMYFFYFKDKLSLQFLL